MVISLLTTATGTRQTSETQIAWEHETVGPLVSGEMLLVFVGAVDSQHPSVTSAIFSGTGLTPFDSQNLEVVSSVVGAGGGSFPCGFVYSLDNPITGTGTVTGTVTLDFNESIGVMSGVSAIFTGGSGVLDGPAGSVTENTEIPNYSIFRNFTTTAANSLVIDMCISESSNHNSHVVPSGQTGFGDVKLSGPRFTTTYSGVSSPSTVNIGREQVGGTFAAATLITLALRDKP